MKTTLLTKSPGVIPSVEPPRRSRPHLGVLLQAGSLIALLAVMIYFSIVAPAFMTLGNVANVLEQSAILGVLSFGMTILMIGGGSNVITGGIDLSLANNLGLGAAVCSSLIQSGRSDAVAIGLTLMVGLSVRLLNAIAIVGLGILPLLATLTVMNICAGFKLVRTQNTVVPATSAFLAALADNGPFGLSNLAYVFLALVFLALALLLALAVGFTPWGLRLSAVGAFRQAARAAGLHVRWYIAASYVLSGLCASVGAVLSVSLLNGSSTGSGAMLLSVVVSSLLGVMFSPRLVPTISGTFLSVLFIGLLINGFQLTNVSSYWVNGVEGVLILFVVAATSLLRRSES